MRPCLAALPLALSLGACARYTPPGPPAPREALPVNASFGRSWDAVIDVFAERNIPIRTIERVSGLIVADVSTVPYEPRPGRAPQKDIKADCGHQGPRLFFPTHVVYNIVVRGDSSRSQVRATARWTHIPFDPKQVSHGCSTSGVWEAAVEEAIRERAERAAPRNAISPAAAPQSTATMPGAPPSLPPPAPAARGSASVPVTFYVDLTGSEGAKHPVADYTLLVVSLHGDSTYFRTDDSGTATGTLAPGRYRVLRYRPTSFRDQSYYWELPFIVSAGMPAVTLSSENARRP